MLCQAPDDVGKCIPERIPSFMGRSAAVFSRNLGTPDAVRGVRGLGQCIAIREAFALCRFLATAVRSAPRESLRPPVGRSARVVQAGVCGTKMESVVTPSGELEASRAVAQALVERLGVESAKNGVLGVVDSQFSVPESG